MKSKPNLNLISVILTIIYMICIVVSAWFLSDSDIATILIPIILYTVVNIILRNSQQGDSNLRLQDFNDFNLVGYAINYVLLSKVNIHKIIANNVFHDKNLGEDKWFITLILILGILIVLFICELVVPKGSKKLNNNSHYQ